MSDKKHILIIEDNVAFSKMLKLRLSSKGFETSLAEDGLTGLNMARELIPDLIFLDLMLPKMHGHQVCRMIKFDKKMQHIPVIIFTSRDLDEDADLANECGADAFMVKTTRSEIMLDVVEKLLAKEINKKDESE